MAAPDITAVDAFLRPETSTYVLLDRTATPGAPLRAEINAGLTINPILTAVDGLQDGTNFVDVATFASLRTGTAVGRSPSISGTLSTLGDKAGNDIRAEITKLDKKTLLIMDEGDVPGSYMDVWDVVVGSVAPDNSVDSYMTVMVSLAVSNTFARVVIPS